jgi:hypothetical protein
MSPLRKVVVVLVSFVLVSSGVSAIMTGDLNARGLAGSFSFVQVEGWSARVMGSLVIGVGLLGFWSVLRLWVANY